MHFKYIVVCQSRGRGIKMMENYGTNLSPKIQDLVPWIGEQGYIKMLVLHLSINLDIFGYMGKFLEHFNIRLLSNPRDKILILVKNL